jgi:hypothetical protein
MGNPYDHAAVARQVWDHLARSKADLSVFEIGRALGYTYQATGRQSVNTPKIRAALAELAADGRVLRYSVPWPCRGGYKTVWHAKTPEGALSGRT